MLDPDVRVQGHAKLEQAGGAKNCTYAGGSPAAAPARL
jgi:hypothetical protein